MDMSEAHCKTSLLLACLQAQAMSELKAVVEKLKPDGFQPKVGETGLLDSLVHEWP